MKQFFPFIFITLCCGLGACEKTAMPQADQQFRIQAALTVDGRSRTYLLNLPPAYYEGNGSFALVIGLHGLGGSGLQFEQDYHFSRKARESSFVVVYPDGVKSNGPLGLRSWNAGACCGYAEMQGVDDVGFIRRLIDTLLGEYAIDPGRVYVTGMSNGGMMAYRLACELPERIAAVAAVSSTMMAAQPCSPSLPVPILHIHSAPDTKVPYQGGTGLGGYSFPPVDSVLEVWALNNGCAGPASLLEDNPGYWLKEWRNCNRETVVRSYLTKDGGHAWPGGLRSRLQADLPSEAIDATERIWDFFISFSRP